MTYPLLLTLGLLQSDKRMVHTAYETLAFLPKLLKRHHKGASAPALAAFKRQISWQALTEVLAGVSATALTDSGYAYVLCTVCVLVFLSSCFARALSAFFCAACLHRSQVSGEV